LALPTLVANSDNLKSSPFSLEFAIPNNELIDYSQTMPMEINNKISDGLVSLNRITDPKSSSADCKSAPAALNMIDKYTEERRTSATPNFTS
jgi:hypothetical protein